MAIKFLKLANIQSTTNEAGVVTLTGTPEEAALLPAITDVALTPFQINDETGFKSNSAAAIATLSWTGVGMVFMDYLHARSTGESILPFVDMLPGVAKDD